MIEARALGARAGAFALHDVSFTLPAGQWGIVLGPAGAGKTTLLETIAGVRRATAGRVLLRGLDATHAPAEGRGIGIVYQHGYLFPHLGVRDNVCYGTADAAYALALLDRLGGGALAGRAVGALSGGERQVVSLARALAPRPDILLLDEPFSALDPRRRAGVRRALHALQREQGLTVLQVTHDFAEAGTLGDLALLVEGGRLVQSGPPDALFRRPATAAAADFLGAENVYAGVVEAPADSAAGEESSGVRFSSGALTLIAAVEGPAPGRAHAVIRGEDVTLARERPGPSSARNVLAGVVVDVVADGPLSRVTLEVNGAPLVATVTAAAARELGVASGVPMVAVVKATAVHLC